MAGLLVLLVTGSVAADAQVRADRPSTRATPPPRALSQYRRTAWTAQDGAPPKVVSFAQSRDGHLWLAASTGLYRFDGVTFEEIEPADDAARSDDPCALLAAQDGSIWVGYRSGRFARYRNGVLEPVPAPPAPQRVLRLEQTRDGAIWAVIGMTEPTIVRFANGRWQPMDRRLGLQRQLHIHLHAAPDGSLWMATDDALYRLPAGGARLEKVRPLRGLAAVTSDHAGTIWMADDTGTRAVARNGRLVEEAVLAKQPPVRRAPSLVSDRLGNLWGTDGDVVHRISERDGSLETLRAEDGLTGGRLAEIFEDGEGNIWISTSTGLNRLSPTNIVSEPGIGAQPGAGYGLIAMRDGAVYITSADALFRAGPGERPVRVADGQFRSSAICEDGATLGFAFGADRVFRLERVISSFEAPRLTGRNFVVNCAIDKAGRLWANTAAGDVYIRDPKGWRQLRPQSPETPPHVIVFTDQTRQILSFDGDGKFRRLDAEGRGTAVLGSLPGVSDIDGVLLRGKAIYATWVGGLTRVENGRVETLPPARAPWSVHAPGLANAADGALWLLGDQGIVRIDSEALEHAFRDPKFQLRPVRFSFAQGLPDYGYTGTAPGAITGGDGRIWFRTFSRVIWIDPAHLLLPTAPVPVTITAAQWGGGRRRDPARIDLPAGTRQLTIRYAGLRLTTPQEVRFRYRLIGADEGWFEAGASRQAIFTNLAPGSYRFEVQAADGDGGWGKAATLEIRMPPTFLQSRMFVALCVLAGLAVLGLLYLLHVRQVKAGMLRQFQIRTAERTRIARDLHDTLLQGVQALMLRVQTVADQLPGDQPQHRALDSALGQAENLVVEARHRVLDLRVPSDNDPLAALSAFAAPLVEASGVQLEVETSGHARPIAPLVADELVRIGEEAIRNAIAHSGGRKLILRLDHGARLMLEICDDGIGIDAARVATPQDAHFGLVGMRERAARIGATLAVERIRAGGTRVRLLVPGRRAYGGGLLRRIFRGGARRREGPSGR
jgi:signal transduction histidine kinase/ligand-binding sensor domain-containing protein